jgi:hypothetical protein
MPHAFTSLDVLAFTRHETFMSVAKLGLDWIVRHVAAQSEARPSGHEAAAIAEQACAQESVPPSITTTPISGIGGVV